jgi:hypothetical protein
MIRSFVLYMFTLLHLLLFLNLTMVILRPTANLKAVLNFNDVTHIHPCSVGRWIVFTAIQNIPSPISSHKSALNFREDRIIQNESTMSSPANIHNTILVATLKFKHFSFCIPAIQFDLENFIGFMAT